MNTKNILMTSIALLMSFSCEKVIEDGNDILSRERVVFTASMEESAQTKAVLGNNGSRILWESGDEISILYKDASSKFTATIQTSSPTTDFSGTLSVTEDGSSSFWAVYPYNETNTLSGEYVTINIPDKQTASDNTFDRTAFVTMAKSNDHSLQFYNLCGGVKFSVKQSGIKRVVFKGNNGEIVAGQVSAGFGEDGKPVVNQVISGKTSIELSAPNGQVFQEGVWYYIAALPGSLNQGFTIDFYGDEAFSMSSSDAVSIKRAFWGQISEADQWTLIPIEDPNFKAYLVENYDTNGDGEISIKEGEAITLIAIDGLESLSSLKGIEYFTNLKDLSCGLTDIAELDLSNNLKLEGLCCEGATYITSLFLNNNTELRRLQCGSTSIAELDLSNNLKLEDLTCSSTKITSLDLSKNTELVYLLCSFSNITSLDISHNTKLRYLYCQSTSLTKLDISSCEELEIVDCAGGVDDKEPDSSDPRGYVALGKIQELVIGNNRKLRYLNCTGNVIAGTLDLSNCPELQIAYLYYNEFSTLKLGSHPNLETLYLAGCWNLTSLDLSGCPNLNWISTVACFSLGGIDFSNNARLETAYDIPAGSNITGLKNLKWWTGSVEGFDLSPLINLEGLYTWHFSGLDLSQVPSLKELQVGTTNTTVLDISPLVNLEYLLLDSWSSIKELDISHNLKLNNVTVASEALQKLYADRSQQIEGITVNRSAERIHPNTEIIVLQNGHAVVDLGLSVKWATCNVGATKPEEYGDYFAWGETEPKAEYTFETYKWTNGEKYNNGEGVEGYIYTKYCIDERFWSGTGGPDGKTVLDPEDDAAHVKWGAAWRMPTREEYQELIDNCIWTWETINGIKGYKATSNVSGYKDKWVFFPAAGKYFHSSELSGVGINGTYWSSSFGNPHYGITPILYDPEQATDFFPGVAMYMSPRDCGMTIRPVTE